MEKVEECVQRQSQIDDLGRGRRPSRRGSPCAPTELTDDQLDQVVGGGSTAVTGDNGAFRLVENEGAVNVSHELNKNGKGSNFVESESPGRAVRDDKGGLRDGRGGNGNAVNKVLVFPRGR
jgi:hypothetical protein